MRRLFFGVSAAILLAVGGFVAYGFYAYHAPSVAAEQTLIVPSRSGGRGVAAQLHAAGLAPPFALMALPMLASGHTGHLKAGEYALTAGMTPAQIIAKIASGEVVVHRLTIPEGWNIYQVRAALLAEPLLTCDLPAAIAEGSIFPDTVYFSRGEARSALLARMQQARNAVLATLWNQRAPDSVAATPEQAVILASVVERETGLPEERPLIAGVFSHRLRIGMPLQSDPTVAYGIVAMHGGVPMAAPLTLADLRADTPYNSYTRTGLPAGPICNPGRDALNAVLHPAPTEALYFVATGHGGHTFAATLAEHQHNVAVYRAVLHNR